jgi:GNAT superfamily N-acetyltransferase
MVYNYYTLEKIMNIINLTKEYEGSYFVCLEDWSDEMIEAGNHKEQWYRKMKDEGLCVKLALNDEKKPIGMIQYIPIEYSWIQGAELYFILCIWVHGYKNKGVGDCRKQGIGKALITAAEEDVRKKKAKGIVAWGMPIPVFMRASWFKKQGYIQVDQEGFLGQVLLWKPFSEDAVAPKWVAARKKPELDPDKVAVTGLISGWCPAYNMVFKRAKRAAAALGDQVVFQEINTFEREVFDEWGIADYLFINQKKVNAGPPPSYKKIKGKIAKELKGL